MRNLTWEFINIQTKLPLLIVGHWFSVILVFAVKSRNCLVPLRRLAVCPLPLVLIRSFVVGRLAHAGLFGCFGLFGWGWGRGRGRRGFYGGEGLFNLHRLSVFRCFPLFTFRLLFSLLGAFGSQNADLFGHFL